MATSISDSAVLKATGRNWEQWFDLLDRGGAYKLRHKEIVSIVNDNGAGLWWSQMVTVTYERERGLREVHQTASGFVANVSRTFAVPVGELYDAWRDAKRRAKWLKNKFTIRKATANKSLRITWFDGTSIDVGFVAKGKGKSQVAVGHAKLEDRREVAEKKSFWSEALRRLKEQLES